MPLIPPTPPPGTRTRQSEDSQPGSRAAGDAQLRQVATAFEEIFTRQLLGQMSQTTGTEQSGAGRMYQDLYQEQVAKLGASSEEGRGGLGIARLLMKQWGLE